MTFGYVKPGDLIQERETDKCDLIVSNRLYSWSGTRKWCEIVYITSGGEIRYANRFSSTKINRVFRRGELIADLSAR